MDTCGERAMKASGAAIAAESLGKVFPDGLETLRDISLRVEPGEFVALLGPSGCGKTTLLRLVAGLEAPTAGRLSVDHAASGGAPEIGYVFQTPTLMPWASLAENIRLPLTLRHVPRREADRSVAEALERVGLADFAKTLPSRLSGGMAMRASLARALVTRPDLLLLDEPFAALDEMTRFRLGEELSALQAELGFTVLFVTHSVYEAAFLAARVLVFSSRPGRIVGEAENAAPMPRQPEHRSEAAFQTVVEELRRLLSEGSASSSPSRPAPQNMS
ncbi:nitrate/sulfonate/bicarbonate ABC transporter ATP-binding protein [Afifella sp. IM 167]|nr:nitrate/sulfonate/bicarbonate ABC transporter ATP-binding protein [Afifella sp. IM 167]